MQSIFPLTVPVRELLKSFFFFFWHSTFFQSFLRRGGRQGWRQKDDSSESATVRKKSSALGLYGKVALRFEIRLFYKQCHLLVTGEVCCVTSIGSCYIWSRTAGCSCKDLTITADGGGIRQLLKVPYNNNHFLLFSLIRVLRKKMLTLLFFCKWI